MDADVAELVREERLKEAADLAAARGDHKTASEILERACAFGEAAAEALAAADAARAVQLAVQAGDDALAALATSRVPTECAAKVAYLLERRGHDGWAARLFERAGQRAEAARAWERAADPLRAAEIHEAMRDPAAAARVLEAGLRRDPEAAALLVALGALLLRYGKVEGAVRALQRVSPDAHERRAALALLVKALDRLGMTQASAEAQRELDLLGGAPAMDAAAAAAVDAPVKTRLFGRYEIVREVASSPTARVVECTDVVRGEHVAVKIFAAYDARGAGRDALARFEREVRVLAALAHPNVVPLRDYVGDGPAIVLAWMGGGTLEQMLAAAPIAPSRAVEIASAVLSALGEAHRAGILHRDVKPANVLFDDAGTPRLADFGVAHLGDLSTTATAGLIGTLAYMAPEQREGRPATVQSDVYAVGVLLREMLTGERPQPGEPPRTRPSAAHKDIGARHDEIVVGMAAEDPAARPHDAVAARRALLALAWPSTVERAAPVRSEGRRASDRPAPMRVRTQGGADVDGWISRPIQRVPLDDRTLSRARAFAHVVEPVMQTVLRVDRDANEIWLERPRGAPLARPISTTERARLRAALDALHAAGVTHGKVDSDHLLLDPISGELMLLFTPDAEPTSTVDLDRIALSRL